MPGWEGEGRRLSARYSISYLPYDRRRQNKKRHKRHYNYIYIKIGKGRDRSFIILIQLYYYLLVLLIGCVPGRLGGGNWFHAKGPVSLLAAARSRSDGATCDLLFSGEYL